MHNIISESSFVRLGLLRECYVPEIVGSSLQGEEMEQEKKAGHFFYLHYSKSYPKEMS